MQGDIFLLTIYWYIFSKLHILSIDLVVSIFSLHFASCPVFMHFVFFTKDWI